LCPIGLNWKGVSVVDRTPTFFESHSKQSVRTRVFLRYSRKDGQFANHLADKLFARGYTPDFDQSAFDPSHIDSAYQPRTSGGSACSR
jgi:hypothetical protein